MSVDQQCAHRYSKTKTCGVIARFHDQFAGGHAFVAPEQTAQKKRLGYLNAIKKASKPCGNCNRLKGEHKRFLGLLWCPKRRVSPDAQIGQATYQVTP